MKNLSIYFCLFLILSSCKQEQILHKLSGQVFGTTYNIQYYGNPNHNFSKSIDSLFFDINKSMSNYQKDSDISTLNKGESILVDTHFKNVFEASKLVYNQTNGVFDPTIGNLVNYWNFGAERNEIAIDSTVVDSLIKYVNFSKITLKKDVIYKPKNYYIDFNAIAKGYAVDVVSNFLKSKAIANHLVEIGGEIRVLGSKLPTKKAWSVGIQEPNFNGETSYNKVIVLNNEAMATSGTYRKFKIDANGNRYAHIINTKTGYPSKTNLLSVSVITKNCMLADAYATAFQAMDFDRIASFLKSNKEIKVYVIFENENGRIQTKSFNNFN